MKLSTRLAIAMVTLVLLTAAAVSLLTYHKVAALVLPRALERIASDARAVATMLETTMRAARADALGFRTAAAINEIMMARRNIASDPKVEAEQRKRMALRFAAELAAKPDYAQFRVIGAADGGREIVRVDRLGPDGEIRIVPDDELQRSGDLDYFQLAISLPAGEVYVSPVNLNREKGAIEMPHTPTLRVATPVHAPDGSTFAIVVINVDLRRAFSNIRLSAHTYSNVYVVNERGDYLLHPNPHREFGFDLGHPYRLQDEFPEFAGLTAGDDVAPRIVADHDGGRFGVAWETVSLAGGPRVTVVEAVPYAQLLAAATAIRNSSLEGGLIAVLCAMILAIAVARSMTRPLVQMTRAVEGFARDEAIAVPVGGSGEIRVLADAFARMADEARQKTAALKQEIEERRRIFDTSPDIILVTDRKGTFSRVSPACEPILGYRPEEMIGRSAVNFVFPDDLESTREEMRAARRGHVVRNFESRYVGKDGKAVLLAWSGVWSDPTEQYFFVGRDMTEQRLVEEKFRLAIEASPSGLVMIDESGAIVLINAETERLFGYRRGELIGQPVDILVPGRLRGHHVQLRAGFAARPETRRMGAGRDLYGLRKDGTEFPVEIGLNPIHTAQGLLVMSVIVDITESKKAQESIKQEIEERKHVAEVLHNTITSMVDPVLVADANGKVLVVNPAAQKIFGRLPGVDSDAYARPYDRFYPDGITPFPFDQTALFRAVRGEIVDDLEFVVRPQGTGNSFHLVASGRPIRNEAGELQGAVTIYRDITGKMKAQEALRESERTARAIIDTALDAFVQLDEAGTVMDWSPKAEEMFGWSRQDIVGQKLRDLIIPAANRAAHAERLAQFLQDAEHGTSGRRYEAPSLRRDGSEIHTEVSLTLLRRRDGAIINGFIRDITAKKASEEQLRQAQKMEAVGQLTGGIAHDFNNMLTVITGTIDILADAVSDKPELANVARLISEAADRGAELTGHLLAFARKQPLQPRSTNINTLISEAERILRPALGEHIEIKLKLEREAQPAVVDPTQLTSALLNLAVNARDAMPGGGNLMLETGNVVFDESYAQTTKDVRPGNYVMIAVSDTGSGIPAEIRDKIFEPFYSTKDVGKGTGLGLSMVYGFVKQSGGHIKVYSEIGFGTTFKVYLPSADENSEQPAAQMPEAAVEGGNETILVVEDDALVRATVTAQLEGLGYTTLSAKDAKDALELIDGGANFDLLFTDVIMPGGMNGRELADQAAKRRPSLKVLFTSGYTENAIIHHGRLDAGVLLLTKPYRKSNLARMLRQALAGANVPVTQPAKARSKAS